MPYRATLPVRSKWGAVHELARALCCRAHCNGQAMDGFPETDLNAIVDQAFLNSRRVATGHNGEDGHS